MRTLPNLQFEQDILRELAAQYGPEMGATGRRGHALEMCRLATAAGLVRSELAYPCCVGRAPGDLIDQARIRLDLVRVLIREIHASDPGAFAYDALVRSMGQQLEWLADGEDGPEGLWAVSAANGLDARALDIEIGERLRAYDRRSRLGDWTPAAPECLESLIP